MEHKYEYLADMHTHTVASGHAYNTIQEMVDSAKRKGLKLFGITDHAVTMPGTCHEFYFHNLKMAKRDYEGIEVCLGVELNIIDFNGKVDMPEADLKEMDITIASIHNSIGYHAGSVEENTNAILGAIRNPLINIIGHPDDGNIPLDYEKVVKAARDYETLLEVNNNSIDFRFNARANDKIMLELCKKYKVPVIIGSDAHAEDKVGMHDRALELIDEVGFDYELVMNFHLDKLRKYLNKYKTFN